MGTELFGANVKDESLEIPSVPPGFEAFASFALKRVEEKSTVTNYLESASASDIVDTAKLTRSLRRRPWINHRHDNNSSEDESDIDQLYRVSAKPGLPKGVIRGCPECSNCQKVIARWRPEDACRPDIAGAPVFYPSEEEFGDTLKYIASIRLEAEQYGICRIVPPPSWKPPCPLKEKSVWECSKFATRVQRIDKLQNRSSMRKMLKIQNHARKRRKCMRMEVDCGLGSANTMGPGNVGLNEAESFGFEAGPAFTLDTFQKYAGDFKAQYFGNMSTLTEEPSLEIIEGEYWRMVEKPTEEIEVLYGADLETGNFGSGFPKMSNQVSSSSNEKYINSGWNLNTIPRLPGSVLSYESSDISGVLVPWLYIGMCFSSFCWHVEDHHLYSLNYLHWGAPKIWYGVSARDALKLEAAMRKHLPDLFEEQPDLLHKLVTQLSPSILKSEGVPVYRCVQNAGEFVLTFPRAYHSGFNCGFNCAEAVNVAPVDWLPHGQNAVELYHEQGRRTSISHDKLLLGAAREAVKALWELNLLKKHTTDNLRWKAVCGKDGILTKALKTRIEMERARREFLCSSSQAMKMESSFDATSERECAICLFDLHMSAAGCHCSPDRYTCLSHVKQLCECAWNDKFFLFRYDISEFYTFIEALEGKLIAVYRWAKLDLGLGLSSMAKSSLVVKEEEEKVLPISGLSVSCCQVSKEDTSYAESSTEERPEVKKASVCGVSDVINLSDDEGDEPKKLSSSGAVLDLGSNVSCDKNGSSFSATMETSDCNIEKVSSSGAVLDLGSNVSCDKNGNSFSATMETSDCNIEKVRTITGQVPSIASNVNKGLRPGPRMAKVVRRINCNVEVIEFGTVLSGKPWCNNKAIFPKGFRSRIRYVSVIDPANTSYYVSEIFDAGSDRPLFKVSLEHCPNEVFIHISAAKCWEMVRERVNLEISKQHKTGQINLPPLQPPGSLDGFEMFGFSSPTIVQAVEALDRDRVCTEYWDLRPYSRAQTQVLESRVNCGRPNDQEASRADTILRGLFKKASPEELHTMYSIWNNDKSTDDKNLAAQLLRDEIYKRGLEFESRSTQFFVTEKSACT